MKMKSIRRPLSIFLAIIMILSMLPMNALSTFAAETTGDNTYNLWVAGEQFTDSKLTITDANGGTATYNPDTNALTLTDFTWSGDGHNYSAIYAGGDLNLVLVGNSAVTQTNGNDNTRGILVEENLNVSGSGSLICTGAATKSYTLASSFGVHVRGVLTIQSGSLIGKSGKVNASSVYSGVSSYGVCSSESINILGGSLEGHGNITTSTSGKSYGVFTYDGITVSNGSLTGIGHALTANNSSSYGVHVNRSEGRLLMKENSHLKAKGEDYAVYHITSVDGYYRTSEGGAFRKGFTSSGTFIEFIKKDHAEIKTEDDHLNHTLNCKGTCALKINEQYPTGSVQYSGSNNKIAKKCSFCGEVGSISITAPTDLEYDGNSKPVTYDDSGELDNSNLTVYYKDSGVESNSSTISPTDAGVYDANITYSLNDTSYNASVTYEIQKRPLTITAKDQEIIYSDNIAMGSEQVIVDSLVDGDTLTDITLSESTKDVPGGTITLSDAVIKNIENKDVTANYDITYKSGTLTIKEKKMTAEVSSYTGIYDGKSHTITVIPSESDATVKYGTTEGVYDLDTAPTYTNAGTYTVYYKVTKPNYTTVTGSEVVTINPIVVNVSVDKIEDQVYTGSPITPKITITPEEGKMVDGEFLVQDEDYTISYSKNNTDVGTVDVTINDIEGGNYIISGSGVFQIIQATNEWLIEPSINDWTYGETANTPSYESKFGTVSIKYSGTANDGTTWDSETAPTKAGSYTITFTVTGNDNYTALTKDVPFTIARADYDMSNAKWNYTDAFNYDGLEKIIDVINLPDGVTVSGYEGNKATVVGDYTAKVILSYDSNNYNKPVLADLNWSIKNEWIPSEYTISTLNENGWINDDFVITSEKGYKISLENTADGTWNDSLIYKDETTDGNVTFYLRNMETGAISLAKTVNYKLDKTPASGKVYFNERNSWETFLNTISFGLFYKDEVTVKAEATDNENGSGIASIKYYESNKEMTLDEVKEISTWEAMPENGVGVTLEDKKQFVYFVCITDNAGNVTYLSTDGAEYDTIAPVVSGIENGKTYYTTQNVTVTDKNIESITLNGESTTESIMLEGNRDATYTIVATDKAGNSTTVTVTMKPISELSVSIDSLTNENVNSGNEQALNDVKAAVEALDTTCATEEEKAALKEIIDNVSELENVIADTKAEITHINEELNKYNADTVIATDKEAIEQIINDIDSLFETENLTEEEKKALWDAKAKINELLYAIKISELTFGDVDCDGEISMSDVTALQRVIAMINTHNDFGEFSELQADVTHDGFIKMDDVITIQRYIASLITTLNP